MASLFQKGTNEQFIHQKFDHCSLNMISKMKNNNVMTGMPTKIQTFHDADRCPTICQLSNAAKIPKTKHTYVDPKNILTQENFSALKTPFRMLSPSVALAKFSPPSA